MSVQLSILVGNNDALVSQGFTRVEVWASADDGASYAELTSSVASKASLASSPASTQFRLGGHLLKFKVDGGVEKVVSFDSLISFWTPTQAMNRINEVAPGIATVVSNAVVLTSTLTGRLSAIEITYNDSEDLGFVVGTVVHGTDARLVMVTSTLLYQYTDIQGLSSYKYKWRFSVNGSPPISEFSRSVNGSDPPLIGSGNLSVMTAKFVDIEGRPKKTSIIVAPDGASPQVLAGYAVGGTEQKVYESDAQGFLAVVLVRGTILRVAIEGTPLVRVITVPNTTTFDLLSILASTTDAFSIQQAPPLLTRTTP